MNVSPGVTVLVLAAFWIDSDAVGIRRGCLGEAPRPANPTPRTIAVSKTKTRLNGVVAPPSAI